MVTALERRKAELVILQKAQHENFLELFRKLEENNEEKLKQELAKLFSFIDSDNTNRLKGHVNKAKIVENMKPPILVSAKQPAVVLMLREMHEDNHHQQTEYVRSLVQQRFWDLGLPNVLRSITANCDTF